MTFPENDSPEDESLSEADGIPEIDPRADHLRLVEALLFASAAPLDERAIAERLPDGADVADLLAELDAQYQARGVNLARVAGGWTLRTAPDLAARLRLEQKVTRKLSRAAVETLAIVAYHQPVTRAEIEEIRGVVISKGTLDTLMETGWVEPRGHRQTPGRPATWVTTEQFLLHFGLADIRDLPGIEELRAAGLVGPRPIITLSETAAAALETEETEEAEEPLDGADGEESEDDMAPAGEGAEAEKDDGLPADSAADR
jgi:segregation and condensation protein B